MRFTELLSHVVQVLLAFCGAVSGLVNLNGEETTESGSSRLINAVDASISIAPYHAYLDFRHCYAPRAFLQAWCGGAIISKFYILTAAHCLYRFDESLGWNAFISIPGCVRVRVGSQWREKGGVFIKAAKLQKYPARVQNSYLKKGYKDVGLIRLSKPLTFTKEIQPIYVPTAADFKSTWDKKPCRITGSGQTKPTLHREGFSNRRKDFSDRLQFITSDLLQNDECNKKYKQDKNSGNGTDPQKEINGFSLNDNEICTYKDGAGTCVNDSGGPVVCFSRVGTPMLAGLVSFGFGCGTKLPQVHTDPGAQILHDWIKKTTGLKLDK